MQLWCDDQETRREAALGQVMSLTGKAQLENDGRLADFLESLSARLDIPVADLRDV